MKISVRCPYCGEVKQVAVDGFGLCDECAVLYERNMIEVDQQWADEAYAMARCYEKPTTK